jgi:hypothetical protein
VLAALAKILVRPTQGPRTFNTILQAKSLIQDGPSKHTRSICWGTSTLLPTQAMLKTTHTTSHWTKYLHLLLYAPALRYYFIQLTLSSPSTHQSQRSRWPSCYAPTASVPSEQPDAKPKIHRSYLAHNSGYLNGKRKIHRGFRRRLKKVRQGNEVKLGGSLV